MTARAASSGPLGKGVAELFAQGEVDHGEGQLRTKVGVSLAAWLSGMSDRRNSSEIMGRAFRWGQTSFFASTIELAWAVGIMMTSAICTSGRT